MQLLKIETTAHSCVSMAHMMAKNVRQVVSWVVETLGTPRLGNRYY